MSSEPWSCLTCWSQAVLYIEWMAISANTEQFCIKAPLPSLNSRHLASSSALIFTGQTFPSCLCCHRRNRKEATIHIRGSSMGSSRSKSRVSTCQYSTLGLYIFRSLSRSSGTPQFPSHERNACSSVSGAFGDPSDVLHNGHSGDVFGRILDTRALQGNIPHRSLSKNEVSSGPRPQ